MPRAALIALARDGRAARLVRAGVHRVGVAVAVSVGRERAALLVVGALRYPRVVRARVVPIGVAVGVGIRRQRAALRVVGPRGRPGLIGTLLVVAVLEAVAVVVAIAGRDQRRER